MTVKFALLHLMGLDAWGCVMFETYCYNYIKLICKGTNFMYYAVVYLCSSGQGLTKG